MDGAVPTAWRSQTKLPGGCQQRSFLLLRLWPRRRRDSLRGTLSPGEVLASLSVAAPMARCRASVTRSGTLLSYSVPPPQRCVCLSIPTGDPLLGADRAHADRLRAWWLPAGLADTVGPLSAGSARGRPCDRSGLRRICTSNRLSVGRQSVWPQPLGRSTTSPVSAGSQGWLVLMGACPILSGSDSGRGPFRLRRALDRK